MKGENIWAIAGVMGYPWIRCCLLFICVQESSECQEWAGSGWGRRVPFRGWRVFCAGHHVSRMNNAWHCPPIERMARQGYAPFLYHPRHWLLCWHKACSIFQTCLEINVQRSFLWGSGEAEVRFKDKVWHFVLFPFPSTPGEPGSTFRKHWSTEHICVWKLSPS